MLVTALTAIIEPLHPALLPDCSLDGCSGTELTGSELSILEEGMLVGALLEDELPGPGVGGTSLPLISIVMPVR